MESKWQVHCNVTQIIFNMNILVIIMESVYGNYIVMLHNVMEIVTKMM